LSIAKNGPVISCDCRTAIKLGFGFAMRPVNPAQSLEPVQAIGGAVSSLSIYIVE
jgi:hypothetical protein